MMEEKRSRRQFTREFKIEAVELLLHGSKTAVELAGGYDGRRCRMPRRGSLRCKIRQNPYKILHFKVFSRREAKIALSKNSRPKTSGPAVGGI
ncbi:hypothetical protein ES703_23669 [subsurface metagenome]